MEKRLPIKGYEDLYKISDHGNVMALPREIKYVNRRGTITKNRTKKKILKRDYKKSKNCTLGRVMLIENKIRKTFYISRLVYSTFKKKQYKDKSWYVHYKDGDTTNYKLDNLYEGTMPNMNCKKNLTYNKTKNIFIS